MYYKDEPIIIRCTIVKSYEYDLDYELKYRVGKW